MSDEQNKPIAASEPTPADTTALDPMAVLQQQCQEYKLGWQRAVADYQNLQKETSARRAELASMSEQIILEEFIPIYNNFKKAFAQKPEVKGDIDVKQIQNWMNGIGFIKQYFAGVLKSHKVEETATEGVMLDTKYHEAVGEEASDVPHGTIIKEVEGGYTMNGRVIKVARVIIAK